MWVLFNIQTRKYICTALEKLSLKKRNKQISILILLACNYTLQGILPLVIIGNVTLSHKFLIHKVVESAC